jgi:two-component system, NarL family, sensor kinase
LGRTAGEHVTIDDRDLELHTRGHLGKAEGQILYLRMLGMIGWALILFRDGMHIGVAPVAIYSGGLLYTVVAHWRVRAVGDVAGPARLTSIGDPLLVTAMCWVTGGLGSPFFPFYYFTLLATVLRYGATRTPWILGFHATLIVFLFVLLRSTQPVGDLFVALFHLSFAAALGAMLAGWAQENLLLALDRSKRARALSRQLIRSQEQERRAMAGELHDRMSGHLFALRQGVDALHGQPGTVALDEAVRACSKDVRAMMNELHPTVLDDLGFCTALDEYVDGMKHAVPFLIELHIEDDARSWRSPDQTLLFRIVQEAVLNVRKHARATALVIRFESTHDGHRLSICDNGDGIGDVAAATREQRGHFGLSTMRERAESLGARLSIEPASPRGTVVHVDLPD